MAPEPEWEDIRSVSGRLQTSFDVTLINVRAES